MSDENKEEFRLDLGNLEADPTPEPELSPVEQKAMEMGWSPEGADGKEFLSAEEFVARKPLYDDIHKLRRQVRKQTEAFETFQKHHQESLIRMEQQKEKELKAAKKIAFDEGDLDKLQQIDDQLEEHRIAAKAATETPVTATAQDDVYDNWVAKNSWYEEDIILQGAANQIGRLVADSGRQMSMEEFYSTIEKEVKKQYPDKFNNSKRNAPAPVEGDSSRGRGAGKKKYTARDLDEGTRSMMKTIVHGSNGKMTEEQYIADLEKSGYFRN